MISAQIPTTTSSSLHSNDVQINKGVFIKTGYIAGNAVLDCIRLLIVLILLVFHYNRLIYHNGSTKMNPEFTAKSLQIPDRSNFPWYHCVYTSVH